MSCPIAGYKVDEVASRGVGGAVFLLAGVLPWVAAPVRAGILIFLVVDFAARAFSRPRWSPLARLSGAFLGVLGLPGRKVDAGPKRFAARIGLGFVAAIAWLAFDGKDVAVLAVSSVLAVCAFLEAVVGFCAGCHLFAAFHGLRAAAVSWRNRSAAF